MRAAKAAFLYGGFAGLLLATLVGYFLIRYYGNEKYQHGRNTGASDAFYRVLKLHEKEFGMVGRNDQVLGDLFPYKDRGLVIVETSGIRTLRVLP